MKTTRRRFNSGKPLETQLEHVFRVYETRGIMRVRKVDPPTVVVGQRVVMKASPFLDYVGVWTAGSHAALFIEAKSTAEPRLPFGGSSGLNKNQWESLCHWHAAGSVAFVLWEHNGELALVELCDFRFAADAGQRSVKWSAVKKVPRGTGFLFWEINKTMESIWTWRVLKP